MSLVLDCSVTLAWIYSDETTHAVRQVFDLLSQATRVVVHSPPLERGDEHVQGVQRLAQIVACRRKEPGLGRVGGLGPVPLDLKVLGQVEVLKPEAQGLVWARKSFASESPGTPP